MVIGDRVKIIRQSQALSQTQFAKSINRSSGCISNLEKGKNGISEETVKIICTAFGVNEKWLLSGEGEIGCGETADKSGVRTRIKEIRNEAGQTQDEFSKKIGYSKRQVYRVESGKVNPSHQFLRKVATTFSVNYSWIISGKGNKEIEEVEIKEELISWLRKNHDVVRELEIRSGIKEEK